MKNNANNDIDTNQTDTGLHCLVAIARFHRLPAEPDQLFHPFGIQGQPFTDTELLLSAKALTLKVKVLTPKLSELHHAALPESLQQKFDISWFIPSLIKYRRLFAEILIASFFCNFLLWSRHYFSGGDG